MTFVKFYGSKLVVTRLVEMLFILLHYDTSMQNFKCITPTGKGQWFGSDQCSMTADIKRRTAKRKGENF